MLLRRRVVITGMGMISPLGHDVASTWNGLLNGKSGIQAITEFDVSNYSTKIWSKVKNFDPSLYMSVKEARKIDPFIQYGIVAAIEAMQDSGIEVTDALAPRFGVAVGAGIGGIQTISENQHKLDEAGPRRVSPFFVPGAIINMVAGQLSIRFGLKGPNLSVVTACSSGTHNIGQAARMISYGDADVMLAGGSEMTTTPLCLAGFSAARSLSKRNDEPEKASRPWDKDRDGFVMGEGAGILVLEEYEAAKARGAKIYAEVGGVGWSSDAYHITSPDEDADGASRSMAGAIKDAGLNVDEVDYINAHGTSTLMNDRNETKAVKRVFGSHAYDLAMSSSKSMMGHLLGAAGAVEAIISTLAIQHNIAPPTINLDNPDEGCDLNYVPWQPQERKIEAVLSNSLGFGGTNGSLLFKSI